jgi:hypothetical protein
MTSKRDLEVQLELQKAINAKQAKLLGMEEEKTASDKIQAGTEFTPICKVGAVIASLMPKSDKYAVSAIWIQKGKTGFAIPATHAGMETLTAIVAEIEEKVELSA